jgi:hypothetical protein
MHPGHQALSDSNKSVAIRPVVSNKHKNKRTPTALDTSSFNIASSSEITRKPMEQANMDPSYSNFGT